ncbi:hypothetical protein [Sphingobium algorifonticola]|jgi:hypothetical protein|uniref:Uncharacterized protein n=1 Tax=Sphingobium algorifonticola TaxID=2008318 RepID=A0A437J4G0_9SPHN|nr:hypothetical protein [Sphingobium algorifonticola]RVT39552.1 hypothetical protein ENE74_14385 [Sphingobium algorifonticola]
MHHDDRHDEAAVTAAHSASDDEASEARRLAALHGRRTGQYLVDEMQAALRAGDAERAAYFDRLRRLMPLDIALRSEG